MMSQPDANPANRRNQVMLGDLPEDFLRLDGQPHQVAMNGQMAQIMHPQHAGFGTVPGNVAGQLRVTVSQGKLVKNYGLTKMDPYCRLRVGHSVFETPTAYNGSKNPRWNKSMQCYLPNGVDTMYIEIFDERAFQVDDRIAWAYITIPSVVMSGETVDEWYPLSGRQGDEKEGMINIVLSMTPLAPMTVYQPQMAVPMYYPAQQPPLVGVAPMYQPPRYQQPAVYQGNAQLPPTYTDEDLKQVKEMFPNMEDDVIKSVFEANGGNKSAVINSLLSMTAD